MPPSDLLQAVTSIHLNNYGTLMMLTAIGYDYILTLSREIEYVWSKPWTWVSTLFVLARYFGLLSAISTGIWGTTFFPGSTEMYVSFQGNEIYVFGLWCLCIYICAADLVMILRVWALYNRSKLILGTLLTLYATNVVSFLVYYIVFSTRFRHRAVVGTAQVLEFSFCVSKAVSTPIWAQALDSVQIVLGALMCLLTAIQFLREGLQMYRLTKLFQLNRYMKLLVREGVIYFIVILIFALFNVMANAGINTTDGWLTIMTSALQQIPPFTLVPRFILSLRELYARDLWGRRGGDIDTAFGLRSAPVHVTVASVMTFADAMAEEDSGEIEMEERAPEISW